MDSGEVYRRRARSTSGKRGCHFEDYLIAFFDRYLIAGSGGELRRIRAGTDG